MIRGQRVTYGSHGFMFCTFCITYQTPSPNTPRARAPRAPWRLGGDGECRQRGGACRAVSCVCVVCAVCMQHGGVADFGFISDLAPAPRCAVISPLARGLGHKRHVSMCLPWSWSMQTVTRSPTYGHITT